VEVFLDPNDFIVSKTDLKGRITYGNEIFIKMSGYSEKELLGSPHNILRHADMPKVVFKMLWERIRNNQPINAYVKNRTKNGDFYWVFANVTASLDDRGEIIGYYSVRRKPSETGVKTMNEIYALLSDAEQHGGTEEASKVLNDYLTNAGVTYDTFVINLQK
jgi:PAS domain S-box-containing protein